MASVFRRAGVPALAALAVLTGALVAVPEASADDAAVSLPTPRTMQDMVRMSAPDLTALYSASPVASVPPAGQFVPGRAIKNPGSRTTVANSRATRLVWQGKYFRDDGTMINRVFGAGRAIPADVYVGESLLDGRPALILDYSRSRLWPEVRDEVREVSPGLYLGIMYKGKAQPEQKMFFTLDARR
ncbi:MAG: hypothetical protein J0I06_27255 [Planctomycetes bacterium]|nr:hypothetical protein [Planctomycetota bacterium]